MQIKWAICQSNSSLISICQISLCIWEIYIADYLAVWFAVFHPEGQIKTKKHRLKDLN